MNLATFLRNFDGISFWLGFLAALILMWLLGRLKPALGRMVERLREFSRGQRQERAIGDEVRLCNDALRKAQTWHIAANLFSLDEVLIPPRLLAPAVPPMAYEPPPSEDITDWAIPYMPDWPEMASFYGAPSLHPLEALQGDAHLALIAPPGCGKTVTLAYMAAQLAREDAAAQKYAGWVPLLIHAADLKLPPDPEGGMIQPLLQAVSAYAQSIPAKRLPQVLKSLLERQHALLLVDGADELAPAQLAKLCDYIEQLQKEYTRLRMVVSAAAENLGRLPKLDFIPLAVASWTQSERETFISRWSELWNSVIVDQNKAQRTTKADPLIVIGWLLNNTANLTPLELTLKVWASFAGDSLGPSPAAAIEAYLRRMFYKQSPKKRAALEQMAAQMILTMQPVVGRKQAEDWLGGSGLEATTGIESPSSAADVESESAAVEASGGKARPDRVRARGALPDLIESGLVHQHAQETITIAHPALAGFLASQVLPLLGKAEAVARQPAWVGRNAALYYLALGDNQAVWLSSLLQDESQDAILQGLVSISRWLRGASDRFAWTSQVMRRLAETLLKENLPLALRTRLLTALALSGNSGVPVLLRQLLTSTEPELRRFACLGLGMLGDTKPVQEMLPLVNDASPAVSRAAILALTALNDKNSLEAVAYALLHGDDSLRRAAAEALANNLEEGHPTLEEGSLLEDPAVRRAVIFGLARTRQPWAIRILEKMRAEDSQWLVQDAANQVLLELQERNPRLPLPLPELARTPWLIAFAAQHGMGVAPGKPAYELLYRALKEGDEDQKLAAIYYLAHKGDESAVLPLFQTYFSNLGEIRNACYEAMRSIASMGVKLPPPNQYGFR